MRRGPPLRSRHEASAAGADSSTLIVIVIVVVVVVIVVIVFFVVVFFVVVLVLVKAFLDFLSKAIQIALEQSEATVCLLLKFGKLKVELAFQFFGALFGVSREPFDAVVCFINRASELIAISRAVFNLLDRFPQLADHPMSMLQLFFGHLAPGSAFRIDLSCFDFNLALDAITAPFTAMVAAAETTFQVLRRIVPAGKAQMLDGF